MGFEPKDIANANLSSSQLVLLLIKTFTLNYFRILCGGPGPVVKGGDS